MPWTRSQPKKPSARSRRKVEPRLAPEAVIKIGGSVIRSPALLGAVTDLLGVLGKEHAIAVVAGGGAMADQVRHLSARHRLCDHAAHVMAIRAMDINAHLLAELIPAAVPAGTLREVRAVLREGGIPVVLVADLLIGDPSIPESWDVTSDSLAVHLARKLGSPTAVLVKRIQGVRLRRRGPVVRQMTCAELSQAPSAGCVDAYLADSVRACNVPTWVLSAHVPERIRVVLQGGQPLGTEILAR